MQTVTPDPGQWDAALATAEGPQLVVGGPGSGKTEFLVRRALHLITEGDIPPERLLILSFSRRGAADLRARISAGLDRSVSRIPASTFHSLAMRIIEAHGPSGDWPMNPTLLTGPEQAALVNELLAVEDASSWPAPFRAVLGSAAFADEVADFILRAAERLAGPDAIAAQDRADWRALPGFLERYRDALIDRGRIDYGTLQSEAVRLLHDPEIGGTLAVDYALVDEYQDTTVAQAAMLEGLGTGNVTVAGDPYQSIYSFRGAELSNVAEFPERFSTAEAAATRIVLARSFRVPQRILDAAVRITTGAGLPGAAGPMEAARPGGAVQAYVFDQHTDEAEWIAAEIQRLHLRDRIPLHRIGVLVRSKRRFLPELSRALDRRGIDHDRPDTRLVDHPAVRAILELVRATTTSGPARSKAVSRALLGPLVGMTLGAVRELNRSGADAADVPDVPEPIRNLLSDPTWASDAPAAVGFWRVWSTADAYDEVVADPDRSEERRVLAAFAQSLERLGERDPGATLADYALVSETEDFEATPLLEFHGTPDRVALTTLHQSKGMTFDVVFIADARDGVLPDLRTRDSLLGARHLSPTHGGDDVAYASFRLQEEKRLAYSAMCRAAMRVVWTCTAAGFDTGAGVPSRFLGALHEDEDPPGPPARWQTPTTPLEAEAWLRRRVNDPGAPLVDRLASAAALLEEAPWRPRPPTDFAGTLPPGPDTGLVGDDPVLSATQADSYRRCPRRYAFERRLRIDRGGSPHQELGSIVHRALESAERAAIDRGLERAHRTDAIEALRAEFDGDAFGGGPWARAWLDRAEAIVGRLYDLWPGEGPAIELEHEFTLTVGPARWTGRIDRVERRGDTAHVVDYKTGTSVPTVDEAATSLQLGLYVLGLRETSDLPVGGGEFWFPAYRRHTARSVAVRSLDLDRLGEVEEGLTAAAEGIRAERWTPLPGSHCERCPVRLVCPEWPEGREAYSR